MKVLVACEYSGTVRGGREARVWKLPPSEDRWKLRSTTYKGIAAAMAGQWGNAPVQLEIA